MLGGVVVTYESMTREMIQALDDEIEAIKKGAGRQQIPLQNGLKQGFAAGRHLYCFSLAFELAVPDDTPAQLIVGERRYSVAVVTVEGFEITIAVTQDLGARVPLAKLDVSPYYLLEVLKTRLQESLSGALNANREMALKLFNQAPDESVDPGGAIEWPSSCDHRLNPEQRSAVLRALAHQVTFIWGPPGTGKTTTVTHMVPLLVQRGERVLITSHTNTAVDQVLKAAKAGLTAEQIASGVILRIGQPKEPDPAVEEILLDRVVERRGADLRQWQQETETRLDCVKRLEQQWSWWDQKLREVSNLRQRYDRAREDVAAACKRGTDLRERMQTSLREKERLEDRLVAAREAGFLRRVLLGLNPRGIEAELSKRQDELNGLYDESKRLEEETVYLRSLAEEARQALDAAERALEPLSPVPTVAEVELQLQQCRAEAEDLERELKLIQAKLAALVETVVKEARVVGSTLSKVTTAPELYRAQFENVVVDEASMIAQPYLWFASTRGLKRIVVLGDFRQLAPICVANESVLARKRIATSIYVESGLIDDNEKVQNGDPRLVALRRQYRMHEAIGELANELVYSADGNPLEHHAEPEKTDRGRSALPEKDSPLVLCDTSRVDPWCARLEGTYSRYNIYSAVVATRLAEQAANDKNTEVGIMSPYSSQARLIQSLVGEYGLGDRVKVSTVHRFQGNEKDVMIVDLVDGPPFKPGTLLTNAQAKRLLNVAFTRARGKLVMVVNYEYFDRYSVGEALETVLRHFKQKARPIDSRTITQGYEDGQVLAFNPAIRESIELGNPEGMSLYHEGTFYQAFERDLIAAQKSVVIFSPFVHPSRTSRLIPIVRHALEKGIEVHVFTRLGRTPGQQEFDDKRPEGLVAQLEAIGVKIHTRKNLHEKLAFIDDRVVWMGSLNILSHSYTTEQMVRFSNPRLTATLLEFSGAVGALAKERKRQAGEAILTSIAAALEERMNWPRCPAPGCGQPMIVRNGRFGPFFGCSRYPRCKETVNIARPMLEAIVEELDIPCPECGIGRMRLKVGSKGAFIGCDRYPDCRATLPLG